MGNVAIMTINSRNFGNRLQNYALQKVIESMGHTAETVKRNNYIWDEKSISEKVKNEVRVLLGTRKGRYISFDRKHIKYSRFYATPDNIDPDITDRYDLFVAGSDQVWNPYYDHIVGKCDLLSFAPPSKRISYAASFGVEEIPEERADQFRNELKRFKWLSVREKKGMDIVRQLTGREASLVLDPTLLLGREEWDQVAVRPKEAPKGRYFVTYIIGDYREDTVSEIHRLIGSGLEESDVLKKKPNGREPAVGPAEFLWLIKNAEIVITDSFHATVFSILYECPVITFPRNGINMSSRIQNLAEIIGCSDQIGESGIFQMRGNENQRMIRKKLDQAVSLSRGFLENALNG